MLNSKKLVNDQKDCANMLGMTLKDYQKSLVKTKAPKKEKKLKNPTYDNSILKLFGADESILKKKYM